MSQLLRQSDWVPRPKFAWAGRFVIVLLILSLASYAADKKVTGHPIRHNDLLVDIDGLAVAAPEQKCENFAWAAALQTVLRAQKVELPQSYWVDRASGGRCEESAPRLDETARLIEREYRGDDGARYQVTTRVITGAPRSLDEILFSLKSGRPVILYWRSHPYVVQGVLYDEAIYITGNKLYEVRELRLLDPNHPGSAYTKFVRGADNVDEIDGILIATVNGGTGSQ
ncbi:MAG TPA: hypothetical protein VD837_04800 [Terriglobales bacterium]|nr:hypothetical protein [Terriglobales bacterium]